MVIAVAGRSRVVLMGPGRWTLVGRDAECAEIADALVAEPPRSIVLAGPAGVGRTRLVREALSLAERAGRPTRWAAATSGAAAVPLGALAHLLPAVDAASDALVLFQRACRALAGDGSGRPPVVGVDDVHLLDPLSMTLLHQLAASRSVTLVLTVRTARGVPDPAAPLWKDELATRLELHPLHRADTFRLIGEALDGDVESRTGERLWQLTQGNPLFLRELLDDGLRSGRLHASDGLWRWEGAMVPSHRLAEIVLAQLGFLEADEWRAMEVLAATEPLPVQEVVRLSSLDAVTALERRGIISDDVSAGPGLVRAAHPLYTAVVGSRAAEAALRDIRCRLAASEDHDGSTAGLVRRALTLLDGDRHPPDPALLTTAARLAVAALDHPAGERLARAAIAAGAGVAAHLALAEATRWQGRPLPDERLPAEPAAPDGDDGDRARWTASRLLTLACRPGRRPDLDALLRQGRGTVRSDGGRAVLTAAEAMVTLLGGEPRRAVRLATRVLEGGESTGGARTVATAATAAGLAVTGQADQALALAETAQVPPETLREYLDVSLVLVTLAQAEIMVLYVGGWIEVYERREAL